MAAFVVAQCNDVPVKNTFLHFDVPSADGDDGLSTSQKCRRSLRLCRTDPDDVPMPWKAPALGQASASDADEVVKASEEMGGSSTIATQKQEGMAGAARHTPAEGVAADVRSRLPKLTSLHESPSCSGDESTDISTPEHSPRCGRVSWSISTPCTSPDSWSMLTPDPSTSSRVTPFQSAPVYAEPARGPPSAASVSPLGMMALPHSPVPSPSSVPSSGFFEGGFAFTFTLRLADDHGLGLDLAAAAASSQFLVVQQVLHEGAIEAWNRRCVDGSPNSMKIVQPGDVITRVNEKTDRQGMLEECRDKMLLKMTIVRRFPAYYPGFRASTAGYLPWAGLDGMCQDVQTCGLGEGERLHASKLPVVI